MLCSVVQSCLTLCDPVDCSLPGSSVHGILQARILEWVAMSSSRGSSRPRDGTHVSYISCIGRWVLYHYWHLGSPPIQIQDCLTGFISICSPLSTLCGRVFGGYILQEEFTLLLETLSTCRIALSVLPSDICPLCTCCFLNRESQHQSVPLNPAPLGMAGNIHLPTPEFYYSLTVTNVSNSVFICE